MTTRRGPKLKVSLFEPHGDRLDLGKRWERWLQRFERDLKYNGVDPNLPTHSETAQMALLIYAGTEVEDIHDSLPTPIKPEGLSDEQWTEYRKSVEKLNIYFLPQRSNDFALFELMRTKPQTDERTRNYAARLRKAAEKCTFEDWSADKMIKCLIIANMQDEQLRLSCLQKDMTLNALLEKAEKKEDATTMSKMMTDKDDVRKVDKKRFRDFRNQSGTQDNSYCFKCGNSKHGEDEECPAAGKKCDYCKKLGHFAKVCLNKLVNNANNVDKVTENYGSNTDTDSEPEYELVQSIDNRKSDSREKSTLLRIKVNGVSLSWHSDTGATRDIMDEQQFRQFEKKMGYKISLSPSSAKLFAFGSKERVELLGQFKTILRAGSKSTQSTILITKGQSSYGPLLSRGSMQRLGLLKFNDEFVVTRNIGHKCYPKLSKSEEISGNPKLVNSSKRTRGSSSRERILYSRCSNSSGLEQDVNRYQRYSNYTNRKHTSRQYNVKIRPHRIYYSDYPNDEIEQSVREHINPVDLPWRKR